MTLPRPRLSLLALGLASVLFSVQGCGSDDSPGDGSGGDGTGATGTGQPASCDDVCAHATQLCGGAPPGCASACAGWSSGLRDCVLEASECAALDSCADSTSGSGGSPGSGGAASSASSASGGALGVPCDPYQPGADARHWCAEGCSTAQAEDQTSLWCLKYCDSDADCACTGSDCGAVSKCMPSSELGNPTVCVPGCFNDDDCSAHGWGICQTLTGNYCSGGPHYNY